MIKGVNISGEKNPISELAVKLRNPYMSIYYWVKGEISDAVALQNAITYRLNTATANI